MFHVKQLFPYSKTFSKCTNIFFPSTLCYPFRYVSRGTITANTLYIYQRFYFPFAFSLSRFHYSYISLGKYAFLPSWVFTFALSRNAVAFAFGTLGWSSGKSYVLHSYVPFWLSPSLQSIGKTLSPFWLSPSGNAFLASAAKRLETFLFVAFGLNLQPLLLSVRKRLFFVLVLQRYGEILIFARNESNLTYWIIFTSYLI